MIHSSEVKDSEPGRMAASTMNPPSNLVGDPLTAQDFVDLERRWIDRDTALASHFRRVDTATGSQIIGQNGGGNFAGLLIPYVSPSEHYVRDYRLRRDHPEMERAADGSLKPKAKYLSPPGRGNMLYVPPAAKPEYLTDGRLPVMLTEGEFKAAALWRLARHESETPRFLPVSLPGVWNWRGTIGKTTDASGTRIDVKGTIPDLDKIAWKGRLVLIAYDSDSRDKESVRSAERKLAKELRSRGAKVKALAWPADVKPHEKGVDDLLASRGPEVVLEIIEQSWKKPAAATTAHSTGDRGLIVDLAHAIIANEHFARDAGGRLYRFAGGTYAPGAEAWLKRRIIDLVADCGQEKHWRGRLADEVGEYIRTLSPELWARPPAHVVNVTNGLLNPWTRELKPHSPNHLCSVQLPIAFNPESTCLAWEAFVESTFPADAFDLAFQIPALLMCPDTSKQKAILLTGEGANGKSTYLQACITYLGRQNVSNLPLHRLEADRFAVARLLGKLANICPDLPSEHLAGTSMFKAITGGDPVPAEYKFHDGFDFVPFARLLFSANHPPRSTDNSDGFFRRWIVIPFSKTFTPESQGYLSRERLDAILADPAELSGVLNRALDLYPRLRDGSLSEPESVRNALQEFRQATDPFSVWLDTATVENPDAFIPQSLFRAAYNRSAEKAGRPPMTSTAFGRALKRQRPRLDEKQRTVDGKLQWCYVGMGLKSAQEQPE